MPEKFTALTPELHRYLVEHTPGTADPQLRRLADETEALGDIAVMQSAPEESAFLALLARAIGARRALEVGTFTGYTAIAIARALGPEGLLVACDVSEEWTAIARRHFAEAGLGERIDLRIAPALETLAGLREGEPFDFAYIDADKPTYPQYWEAVVDLVRPGGLIVLDNVLYGGEVVEARPATEPGGMRPYERHDRSDSLEGVLATNKLVRSDSRVESVMLGVADGITIALRLGRRQVIDAAEAARLQRRSLARFLRFVVAGAPDSRLVERRGVAGSLVPSVPTRSIVNSVTYTDAGHLADALAPLAEAYREAGVVAWTVWVPEEDEEAATALTEAGHTLDGRPAAMSLELDGFSPPDLGDLDWDADGTGEELGRLNDLAYGWETAGAAPALREARPGPTTHMYRARQDGETASIAVILDTDDEASAVLVATHPDHRRRGLSTRLLGAALAEARDRGMRTSSLQASGAGEPVYAALGYRPFGRLQMWERRER